MKTMPSWTEFWSEVLIEKQTNQEMELDHVVDILVLIMHGVFNPSQSKNKIQTYNMQLYAKDCGVGN